MKDFARVALVLALLMPFLSADAGVSKRDCACAVTGGVFVDSLFRAIPADLINIDKARQKARPAALDRPNGFMSVTYRDQSGNDIEYTAALYTGGPKNKRVFLIIAREMHYIAQLPFTEGFWIFEYNSGKCADVTDELRPWTNTGGLVKLPRRGTDISVCANEGDDRGIREVCAVYAWDLAGARFREKKGKK